MFPTVTTISVNLVCTVGVAAATWRAMAAACLGASERVGRQWHSCAFAAAASTPPVSITVGALRSAPSQGAAPLI